MNRILCSLIAAAVVIFATASASADDRNPPKRHHKYHYTTPAGPDSRYPGLEPYRSLGFKGEYPGDCAYMRANGTCMIDLGYGRCEPCSIMGK
jgi:hypothetical protein